MKPLRFRLWMLVAALYLAAVFTVYRFRHADMTETQLFIHALDALTWQR